MDYATCSVGKTPRYVHAITKHEGAALRGYLTCTSEGCNGKAWYVGPSTNGRAAHFAAHHAENCPYKGEVLGSIWGDGTEGDAFEKIHRGQVIKLDLLDDGAAADDGFGLAGGTGHGGRTHHIAGGPPREGLLHRRLSSILRLLVTVPDFRRSGQLIVIDGRDPEPVSQFFKGFAGCNTGSSPYGGYWGCIRSIKKSRGREKGVPHYWFKMEGADSMDCHIEEGDLPALLARARATSVDELEGMYLLVLKSPYSNIRGKNALKITDMKHAAFRRQ